MSSSTRSRTITTVTTTVEGHYVERRDRAPWWPLALGAVGLLGLGLLHGFPIRHAMEDDLEARTRSQVLTPLGLTGVTVDFTGQDGVLSGTVPGGTDLKALETKVLGLEGVHAVTLKFGPAGGSTPAVTPSASPSPVAESPSPTPTEASPTPSPSQASPSPSPAAAAPAVTAVVKGGKVTLTGTVPSQDAANALVAQVEQVFGAGNVVNQLTVDAGVSDAGLAKLGSVIGALGKDADASVAYKDGSVSLTGTVASQAAADQASTAAGSVVTGGGTVSTTLNVAAAPTPTGKDAVQTQLNALPTITFETASSTVTPQGYEIVKQIAAILKANPDVKVSIQGHTDDLGDSEINRQLSVGRAEVVKIDLVYLGISGDRLTYVGYGESRPKVPNTSDANRAINRRVEFVVS